MLSFSVSYDITFGAICPNAANAAISKADNTDCRLNLEVVSTYITQPICWDNVIPCSTETGA